jgi:hypothetical protein
MAIRCVEFTAENLGISRISGNRTNSLKYRGESVHRDNWFERHRR